MGNEIELHLGFPGDEKKLRIKLPDDEPTPWDLDTKLRVAGTEVNRQEAPDKVTGRAKYTYDIQLPGLLHARILPSPYPAAEVESVRVKEALQIQGVHAAIACTDDDWPTGPIIKYAGQEVAVVAAETPDLAEDALERIQVQYTKKPFVVTAEDAMRPEAPSVHRFRGNVRRGRRRQQGNVEAGLRESKQVLRETYQTQVQTHSCLETHGTVAHWEGNRLTIWTSTQSTFMVRDNLARHFGLQKHQVTVHCEHMGGGFGSKFGASSWDRIACVLARKTGRPVKLMLTRKLEHLIAGNRPSSRQTLEVGASADGQIRAVRVETLGEAGVSGNARCAIPIIYEHGAAEKTESTVFIHAGAARAFRAPGHPQGVFAFEMAIDQLADELGIDPLAMRRKNDPHPVRKAQYTLGAERIGWKEKRARKRSNGPLVRGVGVAATTWRGMGSPGTNVLTRIHRDGTVEVLNGCQDIGTGTRTVMAIVAAEELGLQAEQVRARLGRTEWPWGPASGGSNTLPSLAPAVRDSASRARQMLLEAVGAARGVEVSKLTLQPGKIVVEGGGSIPWTTACRSIVGEEIAAVGRRAPNYTAYRYGVAGCQFAEVEVDRRTGVVRVVKVVAIQDCGRVINPLTARSQICGAVIQGIGYALFENRILDRNTGRMVGPDLEWYKVPGSVDVPEIVAIPFDVANGANNLGVVGIGEPPTIPTAAAIGCAIAHATGVRVRSLPMSPDRVLAALERSQGGK